MTTTVHDSPVRLKVCGVTNREDAENAIRVGAHALGFNLFPGSKRYIEIAREELWIRKLPPFVTRVAVVVNSSLEDVRAIAASPAIDLVQLHGDEDEAFCRELADSGVSFIKALRLRDEGDFERAMGFSTCDLLIDAHVPGSYGGTGTPINFDLAAEFVRRHPDFRVILAGGLTPNNVTEAVRRVRPYAVDVASGVEDTDPRRKSQPRLRSEEHTSELQSPCNLVCR